MDLVAEHFAVHYIIIRVFISYLLLSQAFHGSFSPLSVTTPKLGNLPLDMLARIFVFVPDGINSVGEKSSSRVGVSSVCVSLSPNFRIVILVQLMLVCFVE